MIIRSSRKFAANFQGIICFFRYCTDNLPTVFCRASTSSSWWWWVLCFRRAWTSSASWTLRSYCCFIWRNLERKKYPVKRVYRTILRRTQEKSLQNHFKGEKLGLVHTALEKFENGAFSLSPVRPSVNINSSRKLSFSRTLFKQEGFENAGIALFLKAKLLENDEVMTIIFPCPSINQTKIQNSLWLLWKSFDFSDSNSTKLMAPLTNPIFDFH